MENAAFIWGTASALAAACFARGLKMRDSKHLLMELVWYTVGVFLLAGAALLWVSLEKEMFVQHKVVLGITGAIAGSLALLSLGEFVRPTATKIGEPEAASSQSESHGKATFNSEKIIQNVTSYNQQGGITAGTVNIGPQRLEFSEALGVKLLSQMPKSKPVILTLVGMSQKDQAVASQFVEFFKSKGVIFAGVKTIGMMIPPPESKISIQEEAAYYHILLAPSSN